MCCVGKARSAKLLGKGRDIVQKSEHRVVLIDQPIPANSAPGLGSGVRRRWRKMPARIHLAPGPNRARYGSDLSSIKVMVEEDVLRLKITKPVNEHLAAKIRGVHGMDAIGLLAPRSQVRAPTRPPPTHPPMQPGRSFEPARAPNAADCR